jgi:hypothetical protein
MADLCATVDGDTLCMPVDLTVFEDPRQGPVEEAPGEPPGAIEVTGVPAVRTRVARGAVPDGWPRDERVPGELVKGQERVACDVFVRLAAAEHDGDGQALEVTLVGEEVFRAVMGRAP